jgi:hypothetical protein
VLCCSELIGSILRRTIGISFFNKLASLAARRRQKNSRMAYGFSRCQTVRVCLMA